jgi:hypothetical protein
VNPLTFVVRRDAPYGIAELALQINTVCDNATLPFVRDPAVGGYRQMLDYFLNWQGKSVEEYGFQAIGGGQ